MNPKFCPKCGEPTSEGFKFCKKCGNQLIAAAPQPVPVAPQPTPVAPQPTPVAPMMNDGERTVLLDKSDAQQSFGPSDDGNTLHLGSAPQPRPVAPPPRPVQPQPRPMTPPQPPKAPKKKGSALQTVIIILLILILLAVLGVGGWFIYSTLNGDKEEGDSGSDSGSRSSNSTYELVKANISWEEAAKKAEEKGGYLACIQDKDEEKEIIEYLNEEGSDLKVVYIGGQRNGDEFRWVNGDDFDYADWTPGEPNNTNNVENYVCLYNLDTQSDWGWNDCPDDMYQNYGGQFSGYTAYLIEYEESDDDRDSDDRDDDDRNKDDEEDSRNDEDDARRDDDEEDEDR
ncbi:MAG: hypothetical protein E7289_01820 [Lachnospiraceae bacterium]|nr:hypothetical protein [Lachnospiraceae bacterium]